MRSPTLRRATAAPGAKSESPGPTSTEPAVGAPSEADPGGTRSAVGVRLEISGLTRRFGDLVALDRVDLTVEPGQFVVLLGPSGSGKTTLLRLVAGIDKLDSGRITLGDKVLANGRLHLPPERRGLAMVFHDYALWPHLTVLANVAYALRRLHLPGAEADARAKAMLARVGLARYADGWPHQLSGGEQQRVALARALVANPGLLLCDEPLSNLDADLRERLRLEIATLAREAGTTVVYITHDQAEAFALADRVGVLDHGKLVQFDRPEAVYHRPASPFVARFTGLAGELSGVVTTRELDGSVPGGPIPGGSVRVDTTLGTVAAVGMEGCPGADAGPVTVLVRPAAVRLVGRHAPESTLFGRVSDVAYRGRGYDHVVALPDGSLLCGVFDPERHERGTEVGTVLDPAGCFAFPVR